MIAMRMKKVNALIYLVFAFCISFACYLHPVDNLDRYLYEALIRARSQPVNVIYPIVKYKSTRAEASSVLDSADHLAQLEPLYAIRPLYVESVSLLSRVLDLQQGITALSAVSFFFIATMLLVWTRNLLLSSLILVSPAVLSLARLGTPDALSTLIVISALYLLFRNKMLPAVLLLLMSIWVRTDNLLLVLTALVWLAATKRMSVFYAGLLASLALASVAFINHYAGNYGYLVLFRYSFIAGKYPAEIVGGVTVREYLGAFLRGLETVVPQSAPWVLLGIMAWRWLPSGRGLLFVAATAATLHFALFPSPEVRYMTWAYIVGAVEFVNAVSGWVETGRPGTNTDTQVMSAAA